jgi:hypothetical protein
MTQRTRFFMTASALVTAVGLATGLVAYYSGALPLRAATGPSELSFVPADATAVAYANVRTVMDSEFRLRIRQILPTGEAQDEIKEQLGLDIERDIDSIVAGFTGTDASKPGGIVVARGRFDSDQLETLAVQHGATAETYKTIRMVLSPKLPYGSISDGGDGVSVSGAVAFLEPGLIAFGDVETVKRSIDGAASRQDITSNPDIMKFISELEMGNSAWVIGQFDAVSQTAGIPDEIQSQVGAVKWFMASANVNSGVSGTLRAETQDDEAAEQLRDLIRGGIAAARLMSGENKSFEPLLNSVQLSGMGTTVALTFTITPELLDVINGLAALQGLSGGGSGGLRK